MKSKDILSAMNNIENEYILSARRKLGYDSSDYANITYLSGHKRSLRRAIAILAAVIVLVSVCLTTALAVSSEFRDLVFTFLGITEPEIVPTDNRNPGSMEVEDQRICIGGVIEGTYIHFPAMSSARNGLFKVSTGDDQMNSGSHNDAYYEENGEFIRLKEKWFSQDYHILGNDVHVEFEWVEYKGNVSFTYQETEAPFYKPGYAGDVSSTLMMLRIDPPGELKYTMYPVLINVETGELTDICAGLGVENLPEILQAAISEDLTQMVLVDWDHNIYYADLVARKLHPLDDLLGERVKACVMTEDSLVCWTEEYGTYSVYAFDPATWECREVYTGRPKFIHGFDHSFVWNNMYLGTRFALDVDAERNVSVIDLTTGGKSCIDGFLWPEADSGFTECVPSADGKKLLIYTRGATTYYHSIGVLDFSNKTFIAFSRENMGDVNEHMIYWFDNDSIIIETSDRDGVKQWYIYRLLSP